MLNDKKFKLNIQLVIGIIIVISSILIAVSSHEVTNKNIAMFFTGQLFIVVGLILLSKK